MTRAREPRELAASLVALSAKLRAVWRNAGFSVNPSAGQYVPVWHSTGKAHYRYIAQVPGIRAPIGPTSPTHEVVLLMRKERCYALAS